MSRSLYLGMVFLVLSLVASPSARAQDDPVPRNPAADQLFEQGLDAFREGDYGMAYRRFRLLTSIYEVNRKTTAAMLMAGKSLYRDGQSEQAIAVLTELVRQYPSSRYVADARETIAMAGGETGEPDSDSTMLQVGVVLPLRGNLDLTRALFNGIRVAVEEHNAGERIGAPARIIFRDSKNNPDTARSVVTELAREIGVHAILGPLFSSEAVAAAGAAEAARVVLLAPLATDAAVSQGKSFVFQANPTMEIRGRQLARFAVSELGFRRFGIVGELNDSLSERMAESFQDEAVSLGANIRFYELAPDTRALNEWLAGLSDSTATGVDAVYLPVSGENGVAFARLAYSGLQTKNSKLLFLGNNEWQADTPPARVSGEGVIFASDYVTNADTAAVAEFVKSYQALTDSDPRGEELRLAITGYDTARYLLRALQQEGDLVRRFRTAPPFTGIGIRINFNGGNVNESLFIQRYTGERNELLN